jgi:GNAT superfamily N-acetyltransferase
VAVRKASEHDLPALMPLMRGYCDFYEARPSDAGLERMALALIGSAEQEGFLLVAAAEEELVGFAACGWKWSSLRGARIVVLEDLFVAEPARGRGHAEALIDSAATIARRHGAPALSWLTAPGNRRAQAVYNRVGGRSSPFLEYELELGT